MNPIQVNCPGCQKLFFVRTEDLSPGEAQFQCIACTQYFAFVWPLAEGQSSAVGRPIANPNPPEPVHNQVHQNQTPKTTRLCTHCGELVDNALNECTKCGVIFDRYKKLKNPKGLIKGQSAEMMVAWEGVKASYDSESVHENFVQTCLSQENLAFASQQYRGVLDSNPSDVMATKMQNRIVNLATFSYITAQQTGAKNSSKKFGGLAKYMIVIASLLIFSGIFSAAARPLIALGASILVFIFTARYFNNQQN